MKHTKCMHESHALRAGEGLRKFYFFFTVTLIASIYFYSQCWIHVILSIRIQNKRPYYLEITEPM